MERVYLPASRAKPQPPVNKR